MDELLHLLIIYNESKSSKVTSLTVEENRWWNDPNQARWINLNLSQLRLVRHKDLKPIYTVEAIKRKS